MQYTRNSMKIEHVCSLFPLSDIVKCIPVRFGALSGSPDVGSLRLARVEAEPSPRPHIIAYNDDAKIQRYRWM